jgi:lysophospholipase L1-like esterase
LAVARRTSLLAAAVVVAAGALALLPGSSARAAAWAPWASARIGSSSSLILQPAKTVREPLPPGDPLAACEQKLESGDRHRVPVLAIVGASFTAGVGPGNAGESWAVLLARRLHWDAVVYGDPGAGYVRTGAGRKGPVAGELTRLDLRALAPALVIVQAGHDDIGVPPRLEERRVTQVIALIRAEAPRTRIGLLSVFPGRSRSAAAYRTDRAIVTAGIAADRNVIIMDPLAQGWTFPHVRDGLHPTAAGDAWIAGQVAGILRARGVLPAPMRRGAVICDAGIGVPTPR